MNKIGIFDSGIGGLTNLFDLVHTNPNHYIYVADQKNNPYGTKTKTQLLEYAMKITKFLYDKNCRIILVACNTICGTVLEQLKQQFLDVRFISVIEPTVCAINQSDYENILLIATPATISSKAYLKNNKKSIIELATPDFVPAIEKLDYSKIHQSIDYYLKQYQGKVDCVVLGCTHYPIIEKEIQAYLNADTIHSIHFIQHELPKEGELKLEIYTTHDKTILKKQIKKIFNLDIEVNQIIL